jgi:hypothetical protein
MRLGLIALPLAVALIVAAPASATFPGGNGKIAFTSTRDGHSEIYVMNADGSNQTRVTTTSTALSPMWSPNGKRIAYVSTGGIHVMDADGKNDVTVGPGFDPSWSADGERLVYNCAGQDLCTNDADGGTSSPLNLQGQHAVFSPDGTKLAYQSSQRIHVADANGSNSQPATAPAADEADELADWDPSSVSFVFDRDFDDGDVIVENDLYRQTTFGGAAAQLTSDPAREIDPTPSPDGQRMAWVRLVSSTFQIVVDGVIQTDAGSNSQPSWQPVPDADGDALLDSWETNGLDADGNGSIDVDLPAMGADPKHKDVFIELDCGGPFCFADSTLNRVVEAFRVAPVSNPDGNPGIALHIDSGFSAKMTPTETWGSLSEAETFTAPAQLVLDVNGSRDWTPFDQVKKDHFEPTQREKAFHYFVTGEGPDTVFAGTARPSGTGTGGSDVYFTKAAAGNSDDFAANTFMHELGHNLGLRHGGDEDVTYKPNYLSIMNYSYPKLLAKEDGTGVLDYSRFEIPFDEHALNEDRGFGFDNGPAPFLTIYFCPDGTKNIAPLRTGLVDWNCVAPASGLVSSDTNTDDTISVLTSQTDWDKLKFDGGLIGDKAETLPILSSLVEPTPAESLENAQLYDDYLAGKLPKPVGPSAGTTTPPVLQPAAAVAARVSDLLVKPKRFRAARRGASIGPPQRARVSYRLTAPGRVQFTVRRLRAGRKPLKVGGFRHVGRAGKNVFSFTGRVAKKRLRAGRYRLIAAAPGNSVSTTFRIRR